MSDDAYAYAIARDERLRAVVDMISLESAQRDGAAFAIAIDALTKNAEQAKDALVHVVPSDIGLIAAYQADVRAAQALRNFLDQIINRGKEAEASLHADPYVRPSYE